VCSVECKGDINFVFDSLYSFFYFSLFIKSGKLQKFKIFLFRTYFYSIIDLYIEFHFLFFYLSIFYFEKVEVYKWILIFMKNLFYFII